MADEQFAHHAECDGESFELMCLGCEQARQMELMEEILRLLKALHKARNTLCGLGFPKIASDICDSALEGKE